MSGKHITVAERRRRQRQRRDDLIERLIGIAMNACHHDAEWQGEHAEPGALHEATYMRERFGLLLARRLKP